MSLRWNWSFLLALALFVAVADFSMAQPGGRGRGGFMMGAGGNLMGLLMNDEIREELQLVEDQVEDLQALQEDMRNEMREMFQGMRDLDPEERRSFMEDMREKMQRVTEDFQDRAGEILLPHQMDRLKQIQVQMGNRRGIENNDALIDQLGLTEEQIEEMKKKAEDVNQRLQEKIAKLRQQAQDEILSVLSPEQREKFKELVGDTFEFREGPGNRQPPQRGQRDRGNRRGSDF